MTCLAIRTALKIENRMSQISSYLFLQVRIYRGVPILRNPFLKLGPPFPCSNSVPILRNPPKYRGPIRGPNSKIMCPNLQDHLLYVSSTFKNRDPQYQVPYGTAVTIYKFKVIAVWSFTAVYSTIACTMAQVQVFANSVLYRSFPVYKMFDDGNQQFRPCPKNAPYKVL